MKEWFCMEANMRMEEVITQIKELQNNGESVSKKSVKKSNPQLMKNALYYFPSWEHALQNTDH
jgi:hypothetical protein